METGDTSKDMNLSANNFWARFKALWDSAPRQYFICSYEQNYIVDMNTTQVAPFHSRRQTVLVKRYAELDGQMVLDALEA